MKNNSASAWRIFMKFYISLFFPKYVEKIRVSLKSDKNNKYFTWRPVYIYDISLNYFQNANCFTQNFWHGQNTHFVFSNFFSPRKSYRLWDKSNVEKRGTAGQNIGDNVRRRRKNVIGMPNNKDKNTDRHTHTIEYSPLSHGNNGYANALKY